MFILKRLKVYRAFGFERIDKILRMRPSHSSVECLPTSRVKAFLIITVDEKALNVHTLYTGKESSREQNCSFLPLCVL